jgi:hypothetical protein
MNTLGRHILCRLWGELSNLQGQAVPQGVNIANFIETRLQNGSNLRLPETAEKMKEFLEALMRDSIAFYSPTGPVVVRGIQPWIGRLLYLSMHGDLSDEAEWYGLNYC